MASSAHVTVLNGSLLGETRVSCDGKEYYSFEGIPYAKPPIGKLRFRDPQDPEPWTNVRDARKPGNICSQINPHTELIEGSEDCLYLNVYTPSLPETKTDKLPVLFLVHGGSFLFGYGHYYQPDYFIRHNIILVTFNYRLHVLGFLCLDTPEVPGNAGAKDTVMALKWVKNNITYFNGDSNNITVFGESAGGGMITAYMVSKMAHGLFNKVIAGSGSCITEVHLDGDDPVEKAKNIFKVLGKDYCDIESLYDFMVEAPIDNLLRAVQNLHFKREPGNVNSYFIFVVEKTHVGVKSFFNEHPRLILQENRFTKVPILTGICSHEGACSLNDDRKGGIVFIRNFEVFVPKFLRLKRKTPESLAIAKQIYEYYYEGKEFNKNMWSAYIDLLTDAYIVRDTMTFLELCTRNTKENVYFYRFAYHGSANANIVKRLGLGAGHSDILQYQFYGKVRSQNYNKEDIQIVDFLSEAWSNFARYGKPTWSNQNTEWFPYTSTNKCCLNISKEIKLDTIMIWNKYKFWKSIIERKCKKNKNTLDAHNTNQSSGLSY